MTGRSEIGFLTLLRGPAALCVVWAHYAGLSEHILGDSWCLLAWVRRYIDKPLLTHDFGFLGVAVFFLISGFIITHVAQSEKRFEFLVKRILRIYPAFWFSLLLTAGWLLLQSYWGAQGILPAETLKMQEIWGRFQENLWMMSGKELLWGMTLLNYVHAPTIIVNLVAWTLIVEMIFYFLVFLFLPWLKTKPSGVICVYLVMVALAMQCAQSLGDSFYLFVSSLVYIPYLLLGQIVYFYWAKKIGSWESLLFSICAYWLAIEGGLTFHRHYYEGDGAYGVSFAYAYLLFWLLLLANEHLSIGKIGRFFADISYPLYLNHGLVGLTLLPLLEPFIGFSLSFLLSIGGAILVSWCSFSWVETPCNRLARRITR